MIGREQNFSKPPVTLDNSPIGNQAIHPENLGVKPEVKAEAVQSAKTDTPKAVNPLAAETPPTPTALDEAEQAAFFRRTLELMDTLKNATSQKDLIRNIQLWVTGGHTSIPEWYQTIGQRLRDHFFAEDLLDLTDTERSTVNEFMNEAALTFDPRPASGAPVRRRGWIGTILGKK